MILIIKKIIYIILPFQINSLKSFCSSNIERLISEKNEIEKHLINLKKQKSNEKILVFISSNVIENNKNLWKIVKENYTNAYIYHINSFKKKDFTHNKNEKNEKNESSTKTKFIKSNNTKKNYEENLIKSKEENIKSLLSIVGMEKIHKKVFLPIMKNNKYNPILFNDTILYLNLAIRLEVCLLLFLMMFESKLDAKRIIIITDKFNFKNEFFIFLGNHILTIIEIK